MKPWMAGALAAGVLASAVMHVDGSVAAYASSPTATPVVPPDAPSGEVVWANVVTLAVVALCALALVGVLLRAADVRVAVTPMRVAVLVATVVVGALVVVPR
jgi:hypothetical protein